MFFGLINKSSQYLSVTPVAKYDPVILKFLRPDDLKEIYRSLWTIINSTLMITNINIVENKYIVPLEFKGFGTTFEISYQIEPYPQFNFKINNSLDDSRPCVHFRIYMDNEPTGKLVFVRARDVKCVIPEINAGTWMVELTNAVFCSLGIRKSLLEDDSMIN